MNLVTNLTINLHLTNPFLLDGKPGLYFETNNYIYVLLSETFKTKIPSVLNKIATFKILKVENNALASIIPHKEYCFQIENTEENKFKFSKRIRNLFLKLEKELKRKKMESKFQENELFQEIINSDKQIDFKLYY